MNHLNNTKFAPIIKTHKIQLLRFFLQNYLEDQHAKRE